MRTLYPLLHIRYVDCCWSTLNQVVANSGWELRVKMNLSPRPDNGLINTSPVSNMPPVVRVYRNCYESITIPGKLYYSYLSLQLTLINKLPKKQQASITLNIAMKQL